MHASEAGGETLALRHRSCDAFPMMAAEHVKGQSGQVLNTVDAEDPMQLRLCDSSIVNAIDLPSTDLPFRCLTHLKHIADHWRSEQKVDQCQLKLAKQTAMLSWYCSEIGRRRRPW